VDEHPVVEADGRNAVFLAFTPYHVFLACGICFGRGDNKRNYLVAVGGADRFRDLLADNSTWAHAPFAQIVPLPTRFFQKRIRRPLAVWGNTRTLRRLIRQTRPGWFVTFNDTLPESRAALAYAKSLSPDTVGAYVEDGAIAYSSEYTPKLSSIGRALYGFRYQAVQGTSPLVDRVHVLFPPLVRPELSERKPLPLPCSAFGAPGMHDLADAILQQHHIDASRLEHTDVLLFVASPAYRRRCSNYDSIIQAVAQQARRRGLALSAKYHPAEAQPDPLDLQHTASAAILPRQIGAEYFFTSSATKPRYIIGDVSTSLMTARWLVPEANVASILPLLNGPYGNQREDPLVNAQSRTGVRMVEDLDEVFQ